MEGVRKRFAIQKHKNGDGMILCNWLATSIKKKGAVYAELNNKIGTNCYLLRRQYKAEKRHRGITRLQNRCVCNFITVGIYISVILKKYRDCQKGIRHREKVCSSKISEIIHPIYQDFFQNVHFFL